MSGFKKKMAALLCAAAVSISLATVCYASGETGKKSTATITSSQAGKSGNVVKMQGTIKTFGRNYSSSSNILFITVCLSKKSDNTSWQEVKSYAVLSGTAILSSDPKKLTNQPLGNYKVLLDPLGPNCTGCNGNGTILNQA